MKNLIFVLLFLSSVAYSQDRTGSPTGNFYKDTLTASRDTIDVPVSAMKSSSKYFSVTMYNTVGVDTVEVYTLSKDATIWSKHAVVSLASDSTTTTAITSTTPVEFVILDTDPAKVRFVSLSNDASTTVFVFAGKDGELIR